MQLEIEQKFAIADAAGLIERLQALSPKSLGTTEQQDTYYNHPARDFRTTGEALRIRRTAGHAVVTYKGPKLDATVKTRREVELPLTEPEAWQELLETLGFCEVASVGKIRHRYQLARPPFTMEVDIDTVKDVGQFAEVEVLADEAHAAAARQAVVDLAHELGLQEPEPRSYLRMWLEKSGKA